MTWQKDNSTTASDHLSFINISGTKKIKKEKKKKTLNQKTPEH